MIRCTNRFVRFCEFIGQSSSLNPSRKASQTYLKFSGIPPFPLGSLVLVRRFSFRSAALRPLKVESDINGILPAEAGPCHLFRFSLDQASLRALEGNGILHSTARCARSSLQSVKRKSFWDFVLLGNDGPSFSFV